MCRESVRRRVYVPRMALTLRDEEPSAGPWRAEPLEALVTFLLHRPITSPGRPPIVTIDGRGGSGKTTLAERLRLAAPEGGHETRAPIHRVRAASERACTPGDRATTWTGTRAAGTGISTRRPMPTRNCAQTNGNLVDHHRFRDPRSSSGWPCLRVVVALFFARGVYVVVLFRQVAPQLSLSHGSGK
jgi:hypothetical protein